MSQPQITKKYIFEHPPYIVPHKAPMEASSRAGAGTEAKASGKTDDDDAKRKYSPAFVKLIVLR